MVLEAEQVGRIGCLLLMILVLCAAGIDTHRHHVSNKSPQEQGESGKSRLLTKTDSSINQQDHGQMMTTKSLTGSGEYMSQLIFSLKQKREAFAYGV